MRPKGSKSSWIAIAVSATALFVALGGVSAASSFVSGLINGHRIKAHTVGSKQIARHGVRNININNGAVGSANLSKSLRAQIAQHGATGPQGPAGPKGATGATGPAGPSGANAATVVKNVKTIAASSGNNTGGTTPANPDSGDAGDGGWYFSGNGAGGSASLTGGELLLTGPGVDSNTTQGGIGIAKALSSVPLKNLNVLNYKWHVDDVKGNESPTIHLTVTGLTHDSHFGSGFANLVYNPALNGVTVNQGADYTSDAFAENAKWYSTTETNIGDPGGQNNPQPLSYFVTNNANATMSQVSLDNGGSSGASGSFQAGADDLVLGFTGSDFTRYDFGG